MSKQLTENFCTLFGLGNLSKAPGTLGSLAGMIFAIIIIEINDKIWKIKLDDFLILEIILTSAIFLLGIKFSSLYVKKYQIDDPKQVIIDEFASQILTLFSNYYILCNSLSIISEFELYVICWFSSFILFRIFDIIKPFPINWIDKNVKDGLGIMLDDLVAAIFSIVIFGVIILLYIGR